MGAVMKSIPTVDDFLSRDASALAGGVLDPCPACGRKHVIPFKTIQSAPGAIAAVPALAERILGHKPKHPVLIYDQEIEGIIQAGVIDPLRAGGLVVEPFGMQSEPGELLDSGVENGNQAADRIDSNTDLLIAAGSGVVCDLTKWIATRLNLPFILCGSAPSMNGYTSITATMTENGVKVSKFLRPAEAVVLDVDLLSAAPLAMIRSGVGDLAARAVCNADWKLSEIVRGTTFCPLPYWMTARNEQRYLDAAAGIGQAQPDAIALLSEAVLLSGLSMTIMDGETSPSSGAEHVLSHFWDFLVHLRDLPKNFHGTQVGIGTIITLNAYAFLRTIDPGKIDPKSVLRRRPSLENLAAQTHTLYGEQSSGFMEVARKKHIADDNYETYLQSILDGWDTLWQQIDPYLAPVERIAGPFRQAGVPMKLSDIARTREHAREALLYGNIYRPRYTILDLLWELGLFPDAADEILNRSGV
jgi:glycerol-1-phosphate dehydrogenase [NAD(P)+]